MSQQAMDQFYLQRFAVRLIPLTLAAAGVSTGLATLAAVSLDRQPHDLQIAVGAVAAVGMVVAAYACGYFAQRGEVTKVAASTLGFAFVTSTAANWTANLSGQGAIFTLHVLMAMLVIGAIIAPAFWFVVTSWLVIAGPAVLFILIAKVHVPTESRILTGFLLMTVVVTSLLYLATSRVKRSYFRLLTETIQRSRIDPLTKLNNRDAWMDLVQIYTGSGTDCYRRPAAILYMDVDNLKQINDECGHHEGDRVLAAVAETLFLSLGPSAILARFGGDEFVAFLPDVSQPAAEHIVADLGGIISLYPNCRNTSLSVGIGEFNGVEPIEDALIRADANLLLNKRQRKVGRDHLAPRNRRLGSVAIPAD